MVHVTSCSGVRVLASQRSKLLLRKKEEGNTLFREGSHKEAYEVYTEALEVDPLNVFTNAKLYCNRALVGSKVSGWGQGVLWRWGEMYVVT